MIRTTLLGLVPVLMAASAFAQGPAAPAAAAGEVVPLDMRGPRPIAMLTVGRAAPVPVIFDTGASGNVIQAALAAELGLPNEGPIHVGSPAGGTPVEGFRTTIAEARLGNAALRNVRAAVLPTEMPLARGVFGPNSFAGRLVHVDLARGEIRITERTVGRPPGPGDAYSEGIGLPTVTVEIGGRTYPGHLDTGSNGTLGFPARLAAELPLEAPPTLVGRARIGPSREADVLGARLRGTVRVGPVTLENPEVRFIDGLARVNVGMGVLRQLTIVLDPAERRSWLIR